MCPQTAEVGQSSQAIFMRVCDDTSMQAASSDVHLCCKALIVCDSSASSQDQDYGKRSGLQLASIIELGRALAGSVQV